MGGKEGAPQRLLEGRRRGFALRMIETRALFTTSLKFCKIKKAVQWTLILIIRRAEPLLQPFHGPLAASMALPTVFTALWWRPQSTSGFWQPFCQPPSLFLFFSLMFFLFLTLSVVLGHAPPASTGLHHLSPSYLSHFLPFFHLALSMVSVQDLHRMAWGCAELCHWLTSSGLSIDTTNLESEFQLIFLSNLFIELQLQFH